MKGLGGLKLGFTCFFTYAAIVQFNDPDAVLWILLYGSVAMVSSLSIIYKIHPAVCAFIAMLCIGWTLVVLPTAVDMEMSLSHEVPREVLGLSLVTIWMGILTVHLRKLRNQDDFIDNTAS